MSQQTAIQWTDVTDNIIVASQGGWWCRKLSPGCANCYAAKLNDSTYFKGNHLPYSGKPPELKLREEIIDGWKRQRNPKRHFVASMTDVFGDWVPQEWVNAFLSGMTLAPRQTFQVLTKRADVMRDRVSEWLRSTGRAEVPPNIWLGVSVEDQKRAVERIPILLSIPAKVRFLSVEPLLSGVDLDPPAIRWLTCPKRIDWVIIGGESGLGARPCNVEWIRSIVQQCKAAGVACFTKQLGSVPVQGENNSILYDGGPTHPKGGDPSEWPEDLRVRQFPSV